MGTVTIATNMAGRGTDIILGGNPDFEAKREMRRQGFEDLAISFASSFVPLEDPELMEARKVYHQLNDQYKVERAERAATRKRAWRTVHHRYGTARIPKN